VNEDIFAILALDKSESLCCVKPLYSSSFFHVNSLCDLIPNISIEGGTTGQPKNREPAQRYSKDVQGR
jgi:hypothetical protein